MNAPLFPWGRRQDIPTVEGSLARVTDPQTSHDAATRADVEGSQFYVLRLLHEYGASPDFHLANYARAAGSRWSESRLRTARKELVERGLIEDTGVTLPTPSGRQAAVWRLTWRGFEAIDDGGEAA